MAGQTPAPLDRVTDRMDHILGQSRAVEVLRAALDHDRLHHAYIFHGPVGVGKFTTALAFARVLLCHAPQSDLAGRVEACGGCASCRYFTSAQGGEGHPDVHLVRKELAAVSDDAQLRRKKQTNIPVDLIRQHVVGGETQGGKFYDAAAYLKPVMGHGKVFIIDEAELLEEESQNALLKTLEEPPVGTYLILVTSSEDRLAVTVRSRCQRVGFVSLSDEVVRQWVGARDHGLTDEQVEWLIVFADGSLGRASLGLEYQLYEWPAAIVPTLEGLAAGQVEVGLGVKLAKMIDDFAARWVKDHPNASKEAANRRAAGLAWSVIAHHARRQLAQAARNAPAGDVDAVQTLVGPWLRVIASLDLAERELAANLNLGLVCDHLASLVERSLAGATESPSLV